MSVASLPLCAVHLARQRVTLAAEHDSDDIGIEPLDTGSVRRCETLVAVAQITVASDRDHLDRRVATLEVSRTHVTHALLEKRSIGPKTGVEIVKAIDRAGDTGGRDGPDANRVCVLDPAVLKHVLDGLQRRAAASVRANAEHLLRDCRSTATSAVGRDTDMSAGFCGGGVAGHGSSFVLSARSGAVPELRTLLYAAALIALGAVSAAQREAA